MICPKCGENNADNFRFCGMCGNLLEARRPAGTPIPSAPSATASRINSAPEPLQPLAMEDTAKTPNRQVPPVSGPSMLGLNQLGANQPGSNQLDANQPSTDSLRDNAFSSLDSFFEPEQPKTGARRILLMVVLLAALGGSGWWIYANYLHPAESRTSTSQDVPPAPEAASSPAAAPAAAVPVGPSENANAGSNSAQESAGAEANPAPQEKPQTPAPVTPPMTRPAPVTRPAAQLKTPPPEKVAAQHKPSAASTRTPDRPAPAAADTGGGAFRKGEAYLYGRGVPENCDEAVKYLKVASAQSNAKARSAFGTMYATGHCVQRDLPTSYVWFAMALQVDPNNQILEKDLTAIWNQMTPPERQMATKMKQ